jgi:hypothetical protein
MAMGQAMLSRFNGSRIERHLSAKINLEQGNERILADDEWDSGWALQTFPSERKENELRI